MSIVGTPPKDVGAPRRTGASRSSRLPLWGFLAAGSTAILAYVLMPVGAASSSLYEVIGASSVLAIMLGVRWHRPEEGRAWRYLAAGLFCTILGDITWGIYEFGLGVMPEGSIADVFYLAGYPFLAAGVLTMVRAKTGAGDRTALIDASIFAAGAGLIVWELLMRPSFFDPEVSMFGAVSSVAYPLMDILIIFVLFRLLFLPDARVPSYWLLLFGLSMTLVGDALFALTDLGHLIDPVWLAGYVCLGMAALHPSMTVLTKPTQPSEPRLGVLRMLLLALMLSAVMGSLFIASDPGHDFPVAPGPDLYILTGLFVVAVLVRFAFVGLGADRVLRRQHAVERSLREAEEMYRTLVERLPAVTFIEAVDAQAPFGYRDIYVSPQVADIFGITVEDWMTNSLLWRTRLHPEDRDRVLAVTDDATGAQESYKVEYRVVPRSTEIRWIREEAGLLRGDQGRPTYWQGIAYDITEEKAAEMAVTARDAAERANRAKSKFLSRISHEFRTPLNAILGFGQLLEMERLPPGQAQSVTEIMVGGRHLLQLVDQVLELSTAESGERGPSIEPVDMRSLVVDVLDLMMPLAAANGVTLRCEAVDSVDAWALGDRQHLLQVLLNLVSNGIKFSQAGGRVEIGLRVGDKGSVVLAVRDDGSGIPSDQMSLIWEPFERLGAGGSSISGTGLGLTLALQQVHAMGGTIGVDSQEDAGSTFWVQLPAAEPPIARVGIAGEPPRSTELPGEARRSSEASTPS